MKQVIQNYRTGELEVAEVPIPAIKPGGILVRNVNSLVSVGTEKLMIELARKSLLDKARARPDLVKQVINKVRTEGLIETYRAAMSRLDSPVPLGYSCAGEVIEVGEGVDEFRVGDRVACFGSGYASHAEVVFITKNLAVRIPEGVNYEQAAFVALGAIALHAVRLAEPTLGANIVVIGLGLLGQIAVQLLKASGCNVFGVDIDPEKTTLALKLGADTTAVTGQDDVVTKVKDFSKGHGADAVLIFASTESNEPIELAAEIARDRANIIVPGMVKLDLPRRIFYEKELQLVIARSSGPGIYDPIYEEKGIDYPISYVRWTERRNMEEFLNLVAQGKVNLDEIITHRFRIEEAGEAYKMIMDNTEKYIGVLLCYDREKPLVTKLYLKKEQALKGAKEEINIGLIGAGLFANTTLLPALKKIPFINLRGVATATGNSAQHSGKKFGFEYCTTDYRELLNDPKIELVFILTRHGSHAPLVAEALKAGKHVFVEKPLALNLEQLREIVQTCKRANVQTLLMVGFNRRFSPFVRWLKERFAGVGESLAVHCTVNAGPVPPDHWVHDPEQGGGRIIGEVCHFVDLIQCLTGSVPVRVYAETIASPGYKPSDNVVVTLKMASGSISSITYVSGGDKRYPRERVEIFGGGAVGIIDNFKVAAFTRRGRTQHIRRWLSVDRGYRGEMEALLAAIRNGGPPPVAFEEYVYTTLATFAAEESLKQGKPVPVGVRLAKEASS